MTKIISQAVDQEDKTRFQTILLEVKGETAEIKELIETFIEYYPEDLSEKSELSERSSYNSWLNS